MIKQWFNVSFVLDKDGYVNWISTINKKIRLIRIEDFKIKSITLEDLLMEYKPVPTFIENKIRNNLTIMNMIKSYEKDMITYGKK